MRYFWKAATAWSVIVLQGCVADAPSKSHAVHERAQPDSAPAFAVQFTMAFGGSGADMIRDVVTDAQGNIYVAGGTNSEDFPTTAGAFDRTFNNPGSRAQDVFVAKLDPTGKLIWSTLIGGTGYDRPYAIELDADGFIYIAGRAGAGMPVTPGALQTHFSGGAGGPYGEQDGFVCKLRPDGSAVVFCTYFGNSDPNVIRDIVLDADNNIYIMTSTSVDALPAEWFRNAYQPRRRGGRDAVIAKLDASGSRVHWATYLGGSGEETNTNTIRLDKDGNIVTLINTRSTDMPTPNGFDHTLGGRGDLYLAKLSPDGARLIFGTYVGGSAADGTETHHLWLTPQGDAVVTGITHSADLPVTANAFQRKYGGSGTKSTGMGTNYGGDGFVMKVSADGARVLAATYLGGSEGDGIEGVGVDANGLIYVSGSTYSRDFPTTLASPLAGSADMFTAVLTPDLTHLLFSVRVGGRGEDTSRSAFVDATGSTFLVTGISGSDDYPQTHGVGHRGRRPDGALIKVVRHSR